MVEVNGQNHHILKTYRTLIRKSRRNCENIISFEAKTKPKIFFTYMKNKKKTEGYIGPVADDNGVLAQYSRHMT